MVNKRNKKYNKKKIFFKFIKINQNFLIIVIIPLILITSIFILNYTGLFSILFPVEPEPPIDTEGNGGGGEPATEKKFFLYSEEINENYTFIFDARTINDDCEFIIDIEDYSNNIQKNYIFLDGFLKESSTKILDLYPGRNQITRTHNETFTLVYMVYMEFFDRITGNTIILDKNIENITVIEGNLSNYVQTIPQVINTTHSNATLLDEYEPISSTIMLYHFNESFGDPIDSSLNSYSADIVGILPGNIYEGTGLFLTNSYEFNRGLQLGVNIYSTYNFTNFISVDAWISKAAFGNQNYNESIFSRNDSSIFMGFKYLSVGKREFLLFSLTDESNTSYVLEYEHDFILDHYYHVAYTYDNNTMRIWLDGDIVATNEIGSINIKNSTSNYSIGYINSTGTNYYNGLLEELRVENVNVTQFDQNQLSLLYYNDSSELEFTSNDNYLEFTSCFDSNFLDSNTSAFDVEIDYSLDNETYEITNQSLFAYNFTSDSFIEYNYSNHLILPASDFINSSGCGEITIKFNYTANITGFSMNFDLIIINGYYEINNSDLTWSHYSDDNRVIVFQNETTNSSIFITEFQIDEPLIDIFDSITFYEFSLSEGEIWDNVSFEIYFFNYSCCEFFLANNYVTITELNTTNEILLKIQNIPLYFFNDIINNSEEFQQIKFKFDFSSISSKIYLDYIKKSIYYINSSDTIDYSEDFRIDFFEVD